MYDVIVINLGATSTKVAYYQDESPISEQNFTHSQNDLRHADTPQKQLEYWKSLILSWLDEIGKNMDQVSAFAMRAGPVQQKIGSGTFMVNKLFQQEQFARFDPNGAIIHAGLMTIPLINALSEGRKIPIYVTDPATLDEFIPEAKISGHPKFVRKPVFHALNQREVARRTAKEKLNKKYEDCDLVIAHMGGGVSVAAHKHGVVIDSNHCTRGEGPFSPTRSGTVPMDQLIETCFSGEYTKDEVTRIIMGDGGVKAYLGSDDIREVEKIIDGGNANADLIHRALAYQTAKEIGAYMAVLHGKADAIILTGGIAHSKRMVGLVEERVSAFAPFYVCAGEYEQEALVNGALRVLKGKEKPLVYGQ